MALYKFCDFVFDITYNFPYMETFLKDYAVTGEKADFSIVIPIEDVKAEYERDPQFLPPYHETICLYRMVCSKLLEHDVFLMHSSVVVKDGDAYVFTAKSGTGKSTHSLLWTSIFDDAYILNGDKPLFRLKEDGFYAYGMPWCGKEGFQVNKSAKVKAVCFLSQAKENSISRLSAREVIMRIFEQVHIPDEDKEKGKVLSLLDKFILDIPFYHLKCTKDPEAAILSHKILSQKGVII